MQRSRRSEKVPSPQEPGAYEPPRIEWTLPLQRLTGSPLGDKNPIPDPAVPLPFPLPPPEDRP